jgi:hypothetical protein
LDSVHDGIPPSRRCDLYGGLMGQDATTQSPTTGVLTRAPIDLISPDFLLGAKLKLFSYLSFLRRCRPMMRLVVFTANPQTV